MDTTCAELHLLVQRYAKSASALSEWLERNVPEGLAVFCLPKQHRLKMRTSNPTERTVQQEIKRRTVKVRVFPSIDVLLRLVSSVLVEIDETWAASIQPYINWKADTTSTAGCKSPDIRLRDQSLPRSVTLIGVHIVERAARSSFVRSISYSLISRKMPILRLGLMSYKKSGSPAKGRERSS